MPTADRIIYGIWTALLVLWIAGAALTKRSAKTQTAGSRLAGALLTFAGFALLFDSNWNVAFLDHHMWRSAVAAYAGVGITAAGAALAIWGRAAIGTNWSARVTIKHGHQLISTGPYRWMRHPIYSGLLLAMTGSAVAFGAVRGFLGVSYAARVKRLVPFIF